MEVASIIRPSRERLIRARAEAGLTQEELAVRTEISLASIGKYERGERSPRGPRLRRIAAATGKRIEWFFPTSTSDGEPHKLPSPLPIASNASE